MHQYWTTPPLMFNAHEVRLQKFKTLFTNFVKRLFINFVKNLFPNMLLNASGPMCRDCRSPMVLPLYRYCLELLYKI